MCAGPAVSINLIYLDRMGDHPETRRHRQRSVARSAKILKALKRFLLHVALDGLAACKFALLEIREAIPVNRHHVLGG